MDVKDTETCRDQLSVSVADNISAMLAYWDKNLVCRFANAAYMDWFGKSRQQLVNQMTLMDLLGPEIFARNYPYVQRALLGKLQTFERDITSPDGKVRNAIANYFPDFDSQGNVKGFFAHVADVTRLKQMENELKRSNWVISEQNNRLLNFANIVSHNLSTYAFNLSSVLGFLDEAKTDDERLELMGYLRSISRNFTESIHNLREIVDVQNQRRIKYEWVNLHDYAEKAISMLYKQVKENQAIIVNHVPADLKLWANPAYIDSIVLNFLTNAIKYRHPDRPPFIRLSAGGRGKELAFKITDNGLGIDMKRYGEKLFGMYQTFHGNADAKGIGLFITRYQVEAMGGRVEVDSKPGEGTTFTVYFATRSAQVPRTQLAGTQAG
ncbi:MAG TPA: HAMP domain-containing sensor histidine kinase [Mucilaginibacter sp.]|nr:HAMP domain-containing sensor histidine kinase [Mucilaginibacter sp.]